MPQEPLATKGNFLHIYDFRVTAGKEEEFVRLFEEFDYSDGNPMHKSSAQVKDGVLCRDVEDPQRFFLIAEWSDIKEHAKILKVLAGQVKPEFIKHIEGEVHPEIRGSRLLHSGRNSAEGRGVVRGQASELRRVRSGAECPGCLLEPNGRRDRLRLADEQFFLGLTSGLRPIVN